MLLDILPYIENSSSILDLCDKFEEAGLTVRQNAASNIFICKIEDGKPCSNKLYEDHIPIGKPNEKISDKTAKMIKIFVEENININQKLDIKIIGNYGLYGSSIRDNLIESEIITAIQELLFDG